MKVKTGIFIGLIFLLFCFVMPASAVINVTHTTVNVSDTTVENTINILGGGTATINLQNFSYAPTTNIVNTAMYGKTITTGVANWGGAPHTGDDATQVIYLNHNYAIRQTGIIQYVEFDCVNIDRLASYKINIWRKNGTKYDLIDQTDNLLSSMSNGPNNISVSLNAQEGDFIGESVSGSGAAGGYVFFADAGACKYTYDSDPVIGGANGLSYDWDVKSSLAVTHVILVKMKSPDVAFIGDSICAGHPGHYSYLESTETTNLSSSYEYWFKSLGNTSYQNMGIGSQTTTHIAARFENDVVNLHPKYAVIEGGVNDVAGGATNETILANYESMLDMCDSAGIKPVIVLILPWHAGATAKKQQIDYINDQLIIKASEHNCAYIDCRDTIGFYDHTIESWDVDSIYNADGVHFTAAGYEAIGKEMFNQWSNITLDGVRYNVESENTVTLDSIQDSINILSNIENMYADITIERNNVIFTVIPEIDSVNVTVNLWSNTQKVWTISSETQQSVTHTIGGFPANTDIDIYRDGIDYDTAHSNSTGYITWVYDGGFSEHEFSILSGSDFTVSTTTGSAPYAVKFSNTSNATSYAWDFENDGIIDSTKQNPVHTYGKAGTYTVNLTVQNEYGNFSTVKTDYITVSAPAFASDPVAWFNWVFSYLRSMYVSIWVTA